MSRQEQADPALCPLAAADGEPAFEEAWQAQVLAIADTLVQQRMFSAGAWSEALGAALREAEADGEEDNQQTYYRAALTALESLVAEHSEIDLQAMQGKREAWERAYRATPHGLPVVLEPESDA
jgi:nitrile hydratase accessory protein